MATIFNGNDSYSGILSSQVGSCQDASVPLAQNVASLPGLKVLEVDVDMTGLAVATATAINLGRLPEGALIMGCSAKALSTPSATDCVFRITASTAAASAAVEDAKTILAVNTSARFVGTSAVALSLINGYSQTGVVGALGNPVVVDAVTGTVGPFINMVHVVSTTADVVAVVKIKVLYLDPL